ncbi:hypothetical protein SMMN14_08423, partial [Sphaerulina musiva]
MSVALLERSVVSSPSEISIDMRNMSTLANPAATRTSTPDRKSLQRIAAEALHTKSVTIDRIHGTLFRNYKLQPTSHSAATTTTTTTEETFYILKCRPSSPAIRLLRHEEDRLRTEAYTLQTLLLHSSSSTKSSEMPSTRMIPRLIASSPHHHHHRTNTTTTPLDPSPYILTGPFHGHLLSEISPQLSQTPSEKIQQRVGFFYRNLTTSFSHSSSSSSTQQQPQTKPFGPLHPPSSSSSSSDSTSFTTWSQFYTNLLETLLLDAEDALINLPYAFIRETVRRNQNSLDRITKPKLVFLEGLMDERNILVQRRRLEGVAGERRASEDEWEISGILDWSGVVWGDEWMSDGFYGHFSKRRSVGGFLEGFLGGKGQRQNQRRSGEEVVRQYLYILYHSLLAIIRHCYRPSSSSSSSSSPSSNNSNNTNNEESQQTELAARRNLTNALTQLSKICTFEGI